DRPGEGLIQIPGVDPNSHQTDGPFRIIDVIDHPKKSDHVLLAAPTARHRVSAAPNNFSLPFLGKANPLFFSGPHRLAEMEFVAVESLVRDRLDVVFPRQMEG